MNKLYLFERWGAAWLAVASVTLIACGEEENAQRENASALTTSGGEGVAYAVCTDFLAKYEDCLKKEAPLSQWGQIEQGMSELRTLWARNAEAPAAANGFGRSCENTMAMAKKALAGKGCQW